MAARYFPKTLHSFWLCQAILCLALFIVTVANSSANETETKGEASLEKLLTDIQQRVSNTITVQCGFEQERNLSVFAQPILFTGKMELVRPGKLRWENITPIPSVLIFAGDKGIRCNDDAEPVHFELEKDPIMKMVAEQIWTWVDGNYAQMKNKYDISLTKEMSLQMVPNSGQFADIIKSVTVEFDKQSLQPQTIHVLEAEGDSTTIRFTNYRLNEPVADILFSTCYP